MQTATDYSTVPNTTAAAQIAPASAVCWGAIFAGAAAAAALSLIMLILGVGLGLSSISPWANRGIEAGTLGVSTIVWITFTSIFASALGGYLAGRLRVRWLATHQDEVHFRDTAHGLLAWAVATLVSAALLTSTISAIVGGGLQAGASMAGDAVKAIGTTAAATIPAGNGDAGRADGTMDYFVDSLFRGSASANVDQNQPAAQMPTADDQASAATNNPGNFGRMQRRQEYAPIQETGRIFAQGLRSGPLADDDVRYLGEQIAQRTGLSQQEAEARVRDSYARLQQTLADTETALKEAADQARKASAYAALWLFISLLAGAFTASLLATFGGRQRDLPTVTHV